MRLLIWIFTVLRGFMSKGTGKIYQQTYQKHSKNTILEISLLNGFIDPFLQQKSGISIRCVCRKGNCAPKGRGAYSLPECDHGGFV
jgi:hypothetical protein